MVIPLWKLGGCRVQIETAETEKNLIEMKPLKSTGFVKFSLS